MRGIVVIISILGFVCMLSQSAGALTIEEARLLVQADLKEKIKASGTLDIYDAKIDKVRNLRLIEIVGGETSQAEIITVSMKFRDVASGDIVFVVAKLASMEGEWKVDNFSMKKVEAMATQADENKEYADEEIRQVMIDYLNTQAKFTGYVSLYDKENSKLRKLKLESLDETLRKYGSLSTASSQFLDTESNEKIKVDITVKNNSGILKIDALRIREVSQ